MARKKGRDIHGWLVLDKPPEMTSTQALGKVKWLLQPKKAGHAGTLDPLATGVLPLAFGEATKTVAFAHEGSKTYRFTIRWGVSTDTLDAEGKVTATSDVRPTREQIEAALPAFLGEIEQIPPKYSAIKVDGERAYDLARAGEEVELEPRVVRIDRLVVVEPASPEEGGAPSSRSHADAALPSGGHDFTTLEMDCGKGAYVRALVRDLAARLGAEGHVAQLRRLRVGPFSAEQAITLAALEDLVHKDAAMERLLPIETALDDIPALAVAGEDVGRLRQGRAIVLLPHQALDLRERRRPRTIGDQDASRWALATHDGQAIAIGEARAGRFQPLRVFQL